MKRMWKYVLMAAVVVLSAVSLAACGDDDDEPDSGSGGGSGKVQVTSMVQGKKNGAHYGYKITVKYTGSASDVKQLGFKYGKGTSMVGGGTKTKTAAVATYTGSCDFYTGNTYYVEPFVKLKKGGTVTGAKKSVRVK